jgi:putative SOS response-associated peptidase YedK
LENETGEIVTEIHHKIKRYNNGKDGVKQYYVNSNGDKLEQMCFHSQQTKQAIALAKRFKAILTADTAQNYKPGIYNGFQYPRTPVIANSNPDFIQLFNWGLLPSWTKDIDFRKNTLNARIETIHEKPSFRASVSKRCLVLVDGFYEWQWLDSKGSKKQKYFIQMQDKEAFAFAGLWNEWLDNQTGELINTYTILTKEANTLMSEIHNTKKRMPVVLNHHAEQNWLLNGELNNDEVELIVEKC